MAGVVGVGPVGASPCPDAKSLVMFIIDEEPEEEEDDEEEEP